MMLDRACPGADALIVGLYAMRRRVLLDPVPSFLLSEIVLLLDLPRPGADGGGTGRGILRGGVCCLPRVG